MSARKRTRYMSNAAEILKQLGKNCDGSHEHQPLVQGRASQAQVYPKPLCQAICKGLMEQMQQSDMEVRVLCRISQAGRHWMAKNDVDMKTIAKLEAPEEEDYTTCIQQAWDDVTGQELDPREVIRARLTEIDHVEKKEVWVKIPRWRATQAGWKVIGTRWIDINKGDSAKPDLSSRLVAKEFNTGDMDGVFAATPPLEALRFLISEAATLDAEPRGAGSSDAATGEGH